MTEAQLQRLIFEHVRARGAPRTFLFHPMNGGIHQIGRRAGINSAMGVVSGVADLIGVREGRFFAPHIGERAAAGLKADQLVKQLGLRWSDIIAVERAPTVAADGGEISWRVMLGACCDRSDELSVKERGFIDTISRWRGAPTPKQIKWLTDIHERLWGRPD